MSLGLCSVRVRDKKVFQGAFDSCFSVCGCLCDSGFCEDFFEVYEEGIGEEGHVGEVGYDECWGDV